MEIEVKDKITEVLEWFREMKFCHIHIGDHDNNGTAYCGVSGLRNFSCRDYDGEAICPDCGNPTCPRCAQLSELEDRMEE
jgi:hypothetical protein